MSTQRSFARSTLSLLTVAGGLAAATPALTTVALAACGPSRPTNTRTANPCAAKPNPCAAKENPCAAKANPCAAKANPCAAKANPCAAKANPCAAKKPN